MVEDASVSYYLLTKVADENSRAARRADRCRITMYKLGIGSRIFGIAYTYELLISDIPVGAVVAPRSEERPP